MHERPMSYGKLLEDIRARVRPACPAMPDTDFDALTARMAEIEMKYAQQEIFVAMESAAKAQALMPEESELS